MHMVHGMNHMPTIQMAFSDSEASGKLPSKAAANGDSTAFFDQLQAAARQVVTTSLSTTAHTIEGMHPCQQCTGMQQGCITVALRYCFKDTRT